MKKLMLAFAVVAIAMAVAITSARAQVVFSLDVDDVGDITSVLFHTAGTNPVTPTASPTGTAIEFTHVGATPTDTTEPVSQWAIGVGSTPRDFAPDLGDQWQITFTAKDDGVHPTDRMNVYLGSTNIGASFETTPAYALGFQIGPTSATTPTSSGVQLVVNGVRNVMTNLNGSVSRTYRFVVNETDDTFTAWINDGSGFVQVGSGALPFSNSERKVFIGIRERQPQVGLNQVGILSALTIENLVAPANQPQILNFSATPSVIGSGGSATLQWSVSNVTGVAIAPAVGNVLGLTTNGMGSVLVSPTNTTIYTLTATNANGTVSAPATVTIQLPVPVINSFTATPTLITNGQSSTLAWSVTGADSLSLSPSIGNVTGLISTNVAPTNNTTYILTASNVWGTVQAQAQVILKTLRPNFLFIAIDDLKPITGFMSENPGNFLNRIYPDPVRRAQIRGILTPNIDALAASGIGFHRAFCPQTVCRPSRTALMTGYRPNESGMTSNEDLFFRDAVHPMWLRTVTTLPQFLMQNGYYTAGAGKIIHGNSDLETDYTGVTISNTFYNSWSMWFANVPSTGNRGTRVRSPWTPPGDTNGGVSFDFGYDDGPLEGQGDYATADHIARLLEQGTVSYNGRTATISTNQPFFLACGISKPHLPLYAPKAILDLFNVTNITASRAMLDEFYADTADVSQGGSYTSGDMYDIRTKGNAYGATNGIAEGDVRGYQEAVRHYLAASALADRSVKRVLDGLANSPHASNTVVILWSDHGWYLGEKYLFRKTKLWDEAANCVLVIRDPRPGMQAAPGTPCYRTVSLQDFYPTISSLAGLVKPPHVKGYDISPLLRDPRRPWNIPAQTSSGNVSIRAGKWSLINNSPQELYDLENDPDELVNLASNPAYSAIKNELDALLTRAVNNDAFPERDNDSFQTWQLGWWGWLTNTPSKSTNNPDGDIADNYAEYIRFGNPLTPDNDAGKPQLVSGPGSIGLQFDVRDKDSNTVYRVEASTNLANWSSIWASSNAAALNAATVSGANTGRRTVLVSTNTSAPKLFLRTRAGN